MDAPCENPSCQEQGFLRAELQRLRDLEPNYEELRIANKAIKAFLGETLSNLLQCEIEIEIEDSKNVLALDTLRVQLFLLRRLLRD